MTGKMNRADTLFLCVCVFPTLRYRLKRLFKLSDSTQLEVDFTVANPFSSSGDSVVLSGLEVSAVYPLHFVLPLPQDSLFAIRSKK